jgi:hypothetical protein
VDPDPIHSALVIVRFSPGIWSDVNAEHAAASRVVCADEIAPHRMSTKAMKTVLVGNGKRINNSSLQLIQRGKILGPPPRCPAIHRTATIQGASAGWVARRKRESRH